MASRPLPVSAKFRTIVRRTASRPTRPPRQQQIRKRRLPSASTGGVVRLRSAQARTGREGGTSAGNSPLLPRRSDSVVRAFKKAHRPRRRGISGELTPPAAPKRVRCARSLDADAGLLRDGDPEGAVGLDEAEDPGASSGEPGTGCETVLRCAARQRRRRWCGRGRLR